MALSSDDSFVWSTASSDSECSTMAKGNRDDSQEEESESGKSYKRKLQKLLFEGQKQKEEIIQKSKKRKHNEEILSEESPKKKRFKSESETNIERKKISVSVFNGNEDSEESHNERYLNMCVKQELKTNKKKKKGQNSPEGNSVNKKSTNQSSTNELCEESQYESYLDTCVKREQTSKPDKKKKKEKMDFVISTGSDNQQLQSSKKHKKDTDISIIEDVVDDYLTNNLSENTGMHHTMKSKKKKRKSNLEDDSLSIIICDDQFDAKQAVAQKPQNEIREQEISVTLNGNPPRNYNEESEQSDYNNETHNNIHSVNGNDSLKEADITHNIKSPTRRPKLSDMIRFEDDSEMEVLEVDNVVSHSAKLNFFMKSNPHLKQISSKLHKDCVITKDDDLWVLKCPSEINIMALKGIDMVLDKKCKIKVAGKTFDGFINENVNGINVLSHHNDKFVINNVPSNGTVILQKRIPKPHFMEDNIMVNNQTNFIPLLDTNCRHPLFGSHYKRALKLSSAISNRLNSTSMETSQMQSVKKKKKKHKKEFEAEVADDLKSYIEPKDEVAVKKKRKRKLCDNKEEPQSKKRHKYDPSSAEAWESEKAIEETLFNF